MTKVDRVLHIMLESNIIPKDKGFEITQEHIDLFGKIYRQITTGSTEQKINVSNTRYADKLSGINLLKVSLSKGYKPKAGIVYLISNPSFPNYFKVGITKDLDKRLASYQTYDPFRQFKVEHYRFVLSARKAEKEILDMCKTDIAKGEWVSAEKAKEIFIEF